MAEKEKSMKQLFQNMKNGETSIKDLPIPHPGKGNVLVQTAYSLVSAGTERTLVEFSEKNIAAKAVSRPDLVKQVLNKAKREGILSSVQAAFNRLDQPMFPGYSSAGTIVALGEGMQGFKIGDRVACGGGNHAVHAEYEVVPRNLLVKIPDAVSFEEAAFATLGSVAIHGFRLATPQLNDTVLVIGLGLLGLMEVQIAKAAGCRVMGMDISKPRIKQACGFGVEAWARSEIEDRVPQFTKGRGFDHVLICAGSKDNDSIELAGRLCRDRGNVIAIGAVGLEIPRKIYYEKELSVMVSRSYGPGRYDANYEERGQDYPIGYVRWTEGRNMESFVDLVAEGKIDVRSLISHRIPIEKGEDAYSLITGKKNEPFLGVLLEYPQKAEMPENQAVVVVAVPAGCAHAPVAPPELVIAVFGDGIPQEKQPDRISAADHMVARVRRFRSGHGRLPVLRLFGRKKVSVLVGFRDGIRRQSALCDSVILIMPQKDDRVRAVLADDVLVAGPVVSRVKNFSVREQIGAVLQRSRRRQRNLRRRIDLLFRRFSGLSCLAMCRGLRGRSARDPDRYGRIRRRHDCDRRVRCRHDSNGRVCRRHDSDRGIRCRLCADAADQNRECRRCRHGSRCSFSGFSDTGFNRKKAVIYFRDHSYVLIYFCVSILNRIPQISLRTNSFIKKSCRTFCAAALDASG